MNWYSFMIFHYYKHSYFDLPFDIIIIPKWINFLAVIDLFFVFILSVFNQAGLMLFNANFETNWVCNFFSGVSPDRHVWDMPIHCPFSSFVSLVFLNRNFVVLIFAATFLTHDTRCFAVFQHQRNFWISIFIQFEFVFLSCSVFQWLVKFYLFCWWR